MIQKLSALFTIVLVLSIMFLSMAAKNSAPKYGAQDVGEFLDSKTFQTKTVKIVNSLINDRDSIINQITENSRNLRGLVVDTITIGTSGSVINQMYITNDTLFIRVGATLKKVTLR